ncbi:MAG: hypothetical protein AAF604_06760 [Acidobacteriota bacterium]
MTSNRSPVRQSSAVQRLGGTAVRLAVVLLLFALPSGAPAGAQEPDLEEHHRLLLEGSESAREGSDPEPPTAVIGTAANPGDCGGLAPGNCQAVPEDIYGAWIRFDNGQAAFTPRPQLRSDMDQLGCTDTYLKTKSSQAEATDRWVKMLLFAEAFGVKVRIVYGRDSSSNPNTCFIRWVYLFHN